jgi:hypothetical protein
VICYKTNIMTLQRGVARPRETEIGIRMAIGAAPARVVRLVLARVSIPVGIGVSIGVWASVWTSRIVAALLYGLEPRDPVTWSVRR